LEGILANWNCGKLGFGIMKCWAYGTYRFEEIKNGWYPLKNPPFHHSNIPLFQDCGWRGILSKIAFIGINLQNF